MRKPALFAVMMAAAALRPAEAADYKVSASGAFVVITRQGGFSENIVSIRKEAVDSVQLEGRKIVLVTSTLEVVRESREGRDRKASRSISYAFESGSESDAKRLFDEIMRELALQPD